MLCIPPCWLAWLGTSSGWADEPLPAETGDGVEEVVVTAYRFSHPPGDAPYASTVLGTSEIAGGRPTLELGEALAQVPGVFVANRTNFAQDSRLSIRGFGARAAFGIRGIRMVLDGIPLTLPDGQSQVDSLDLANIGRIEVLRGPAGSLYGNAAGGVVVLQTRRPGPEPEVELFNTVGAFGLWKSSAAARTRAGPSEVSLFLSRTAMNGWRQQSQVEHVVAQSHVSTRLGPRTRWSAHVHYVRAPVADDAGALTQAELDADRSQAAPTNLEFATGEDLTQIQVGTRLVATVGEAHQLDVVGHAGLRAFDGRIPFRIVTFDRDFWGGLATWRWRATAGSVDSTLAAGLELQGQQDDRRNEGNAGGLPDGVVLLDEDERAHSVGVFVQERLAPARPLVLLGSARYDRVSFALRDRLLADGDASGQRVMDQVTGQGGLLVRVVDGLTGFANVSQSFETPTLSELVVASAGGGLDPELEPQDALSVEGGLRVRGTRFAVDASAFWIGLTHELIAQEDAEGRSYFVNAGQSRRVGVEAAARVALAEAWELRGSYTWLRAEFRDPERVGVRVPGIPEHHAFGRVQWARFGAHVAAEGEWTGAIWADDGNTARNPPAALVGLRAGYTARPTAWLEVDLTLGIRNLLDVESVDNTRVNAFGGRYFEPGPPRFLYGVLTAGFR